MCKAAKLYPWATAGKRDITSANGMYVVISHGWAMAPYPMQLIRGSILQGQGHLLPLCLAFFRAYTSSTSLPICLARRVIRLVASDYLGGIRIR
jgi:hypothetical protein